MILIVCNYKSQCQHWFDKLASRHAALMVNEGVLKLRLVGDEITIQFVTPDQVESLGNDPDEVIFWSGSTIEELEYEISRVFRFLI